jgi:chromosome segregation protein
MLLKKIEIHGFKSFADKTEFELGRGVTCLVGPNGCGKSNVVDALRWALGEQRPSALRGEEMGDVVFKGNGGRAPMGFAEVTLVFDNELGQLPIETPEVAVTRKLYRSGESEYQINRQVVRLRDVRELFYDTGLGHNAYAVMEQGKIDGVLRASPVERRAIFEEAAGIQKFRARKREAERKLEKVDQNLLRVTDLVSELESRVRSLRIQAGRARSYVQLTGRLTELKTVQFLCAGADLQSRQSGLGDRLAAARSGDQAAADELAAATARVEAVEIDVARQKDELAEVRTRQAEARAQLEADQARLTALRQRESESRHAAAERGEQAERLAIESSARQA